MTRHFEREITHLERELLSIGGQVEEAIDLAIRGLIHRQSDLAEQVIAGDRGIDLKEVQLEEDVLKILALYQPVATDLRFLITVLKVNNDLERMGDLAVNIAERASYLNSQPPFGLPPFFEDMAAQVQRMVRTSLNALVNHDMREAQGVRLLDDAVDDLNRQMYVELHPLMVGDPALIERAMHTLSASRNLERIADLATNIAEDVIFMVDGTVVRHRIDEGAAGS